MLLLVSINLLVAAIWRGLSLCSLMWQTHSPFWSWVCLQGWPQSLCSWGAPCAGCCTNSWRSSVCAMGSPSNSHCECVKIVHICSLLWVLSLWKLWYHLWAWPAIPSPVHTARIYCASFLVFAAWVQDLADRNPAGNSFRPVLCQVNYRHTCNEEPG